MSVAPSRIPDLRSLRPSIARHRDSIPFGRGRKWGAVYETAIKRSIMLEELAPGGQPLRAGPRPPVQLQPGRHPRGPAASAGRRAGRTARAIAERRFRGPIRKRPRRWSCCAAASRPAASGGSSRSLDERRPGGALRTDRPAWRRWPRPAMPTPCSRSIAPSISASSAWPTLPALEPVLSRCLLHNNRAKMASRRSAAGRSTGSPAATAASTRRSRPATPNCRGRGH